MSEPKREENKTKILELMVYPDVKAHYKRGLYLNITIEDKVYPILLKDEQVEYIIKKYNDALFDKKVREVLGKIEDEKECERTAIIIS